MNREERLAKYRDPRWQKKRLDILSRDEFTCQICYDTKSTLHVHHRMYGTPDCEPWDYPDFLLITLCETCHEDETNRLAESTRALSQALKLAGCMAADFEALTRAVTNAGLMIGGADLWDIVALGFLEVLQSHNHRGDGRWEALHDRYYAQLAANRKAKEDGAST